MAHYDWLDREPQKTAHERRRRSVAIGVVLAGLVLLFYAMTLVSLFRNSHERDIGNGRISESKDTSQSTKPSVVSVPKFASGADTGDVANFGTTTLVRLHS